MCSARHAEDKKRSDKLSWEQTLILDTTDRCIVHKQTNRDCAARATTTLTGQLHQACGTNREKNNKDAATRQQAGRKNLVSVNTVTRLSHNSIGHGVVGVNIVVIGCSSQHTASKRLS